MDMIQCADEFINLCKQGKNSKCTQNEPIKTNVWFSEYKEYVRTNLELDYKFNDEQT